MVLVDLQQKNTIWGSAWQFFFAWTLDIHARVAPPVVSTAKLIAIVAQGLLCVSRLTFFLCVNLISSPLFLLPAKLTVIPVSMVYLEQKHILGARLAVNPFCYIPHGTETHITPGKIFYTISKKFVLKNGRAVQEGLSLDLRYFPQGL